MLHTLRRLILASFLPDLCQKFIQDFVQRNILLRRIFIVLLITCFDETGNNFYDED